MANRIDNNLLQVPKVSQLSSGYDDAQRRFQEILSTKLGRYGSQVSGPAPVVSGIFDPANVNQGSEGFANRIDAKLVGTPMEGLGADFEKAGVKYGVNPVFLASLAIHESNYGKSRIAQDKQNLFGFKAYDSSPYASAQPYDTFSQSIDSVAKYLSEAYLNPQGKYYNGTSIADIGKRYATDPNWAKAIERISKTI